MATSRRTADTVDYSMQEKIMALYDLQKIDSKIDEINKIKGVLPTEVQDLEDEVAGLQTRIDNIKSGIDELNLQVKQSKEDTEQAKIQIAKYNEQQKNVRNNREFDAISKEIEYQELQIQLNDKHIKEYTAEIKVKKKQTEDAAAVLEERKIDLEAKRSELESIDMETADEMARLREEETRARAKIDERLLSAYSRIRSNVRNLDCRRYRKAGCLRRLFNRIPPQRQFETGRTRKSSYANTAAVSSFPTSSTTKRRRRPSARQQKDENRSTPM